MEIIISPRRIFQLLLAASLCLTAFGVVGSIAKYVFGRDFLLGFVPLFDLSKDATIPTWYSSATLLLSALLLAVIARAKKREGDRYYPHWTVLSVIFLCLSIDETGRIHETLGNTTFPALVHSAQRGGLLFYTWVIPGALFVTVFVAAYARFLLHLPARTRWRFLLAGAIYVGGALGVEMLNARRHYMVGSENIEYYLMTALEEFLEMLGVALFIHELTSIVGRVAGKVVIQVEGGATPLGRHAQ